MLETEDAKGDVKGKAALIVAAMRPKEGEGSEEPSEDGERDEAKNDAAMHMMDALKGNDPTTFRMALEDFLKLCEI